MSAKAYPFGRWYSFDVNGDLKPIKERDDIWHRFSVVYGLSVGEIAGSDIRGPIHVLAAGFDVAPQVSIISGVGIFEETRKSGNDTDFAFYLGVSLNLNAFRNLGTLFRSETEPNPI